MTDVDYFNQKELFCCVVPLHHQRKMPWEEAVKLAPHLPKGWWEISRLDKRVKLEFICDFWLNALPYCPHIYSFLGSFFSKVEDLGVYLAKKKESDSFSAYFSYSLKDRFFLGSPPRLEREIERFKRSIDFPLPTDFLNFFRIHDGFSKGGDTGIFPSHAISEERNLFRRKIETISGGIQLEQKKVDAALLFPFYRSFGLDIYQCFYKDWYPGEEVGNVLCSLPDKSISSFPAEDTLAFPTFLDWLVFYLD